MSDQEAREARRQKRQRSTTVRKSKAKRGTRNRPYVIAPSDEGYYDDDWRSPTRRRVDQDDYAPLDFND